MKAVICTGYGPPEVLELHEVPEPIPGDDEVRIKVHATTVHIGDVRIRSFNIPGNPLKLFLARIMLGFNRPKWSILGMEVAGEIETVGKDVKKFKIGDQVFAITMWSDFGGYAEYKCMPEDGMLGHKPTNLSFVEAAALPAGAYTALCVLRQAKIQPGQSILIYGASGSVGTYAVQIAKHFGAAVTGVCSTANLEMVRSIGADSVIDYAKDDVSEIGEEYDVVLDAVDKFPASKADKVLKESGIYLNVDKASDDCDQAPEELEYIKELVEAGALRPVVDRTYPLEQIVEAHRYVEQGHKKGNVVITVI